MWKTRSALSRDSIRLAYQLLFCREPSKDEIDGQLAAASNIDDLRRILFNSEEWLGRTIPKTEAPFRRRTNKHALTSSTFLDTMFSRFDLLPSFLVASLNDSKPKRIFILPGSGGDLERQCLSALEHAGFSVVIADRAAIPHDQDVFVLNFQVPTSDVEWAEHLRNVQKLNYSGFWDLVAPYALLDCIYQLVDTFINADELSRIYIGQSRCDHYEVVKKLNTIFPIAGSSVVEFGPLDGAQTFSLLSFGPSCAHSSPHSGRCQECQ